MKGGTLGYNTASSEMLPTLINDPAHISITPVKESPVPLNSTGFFGGLFLMSKIPGCLEYSPGSVSSDLCDSTAAPSSCGLSAALRVHKQNPAKSHLPAKWKVNTCSHIAARVAFADLPEVCAALKG